MGAKGDKGKESATVSPVVDKPAKPKSKKGAAKKNKSKKTAKQATEIPEEFKGQTLAEQACSALNEKLQAATKAAENVTKLNAQIEKIQKQGKQPKDDVLLKLSNAELELERANRTAFVQRHNQNIANYEGWNAEDGFPEYPQHSRDASIPPDQDRAMGGDIEEFHLEVMLAMGAELYDGGKTFTGTKWQEWFGYHVHRNMGNNLEKHRGTARVYYLPDYISKEEVPRMVAAVAETCSAGDISIQPQSKRGEDLPSGHDVVHKPSNDKLQQDVKNAVHTKLISAISANLLLLNVYERRRARMKCIASQVDLFAYGGFQPHPNSTNTALKYSKIYQDIVVITGVAPELNSRYMDYADFIFEEKDFANESDWSRLPAYSHLGNLKNDLSNDPWIGILNLSLAEQHPYGPESPGNYFQQEPDIALKTWQPIDGDRQFHVQGYLQTMKDSYFLWFRAFNHQVSISDRDNKEGSLNIVAMGCGPFSKIPAAPRQWEHSLALIQVRAIEEVLAEGYFPHIYQITFCDWLGGRFAPTRRRIGHIKLSHKKQRDICLFDDVSLEAFVCGILNPGNGFTLPGNHPGYGSIESEIGENTTLRGVQSYVLNPGLLDPRNHIAVDGSSMIVQEHETEVRVPCIISDDDNFEEYDWTGALVRDSIGMVTQLYDNSSPVDRP